MECRDERFDFRSPPTDLPDLIRRPAGAGTAKSASAAPSTDLSRCAPAATAYARRYAIWGRELETLVGPAR